LENNFNICGLSLYLALILRCPTWNPTLLRPSILGVFSDAIATFPSVREIFKFCQRLICGGLGRNLLSCALQCSRQRGALSCEISIGKGPSTLASAGRSTLDANCPQFQPPTPAAYLQAIIFGWPRPFFSLLAIQVIRGAAATHKFFFYHSAALFKRWRRSAINIRACSTCGGRAFYLRRSAEIGAEMRSGNSRALVPRCFLSFSLLEPDSNSV
jgi:hypothetical protein